MRCALLVVGGLIAASFGVGACTHDSISNDFGPGYSNYTESADRPMRPGRVTGTVAYRERIALPEGAVVTVQLVDLSLTPFRVVSEHSTSVTTTQPPLPFDLPYDVSEVDPQGRYGVQAQVTVNGQTWFASPEPTRMILSNELDRIGLIVTRVKP